MNRLRVAIIIENFFPHVGGVEKFFLDLAKEFLRGGDEVRVVTSNSGGISGYHKFEGVPVYSYNWPSFADHPVPALKDLHEHAAWANVIHTSTYTAGPMAYKVAKKHHKPVVITVHEFLGEKWAWIERNPIMRMGYRLFERYVLSKPYDYFVCDSDATKRDLLTTHVASHKVETVYLAVDNFQSITEDRQALCAFAGIEQDSSIVLYYGRPGQPKGLFLLLDAIKKAAPEISGKKVKFLFILAKEPHKQRHLFEEKICQYGLESQVIVRNSQPREKLLQYVKSSDFVVVPSITEGFGLTTAESCQLGKRVIHSSGGSLPEVASGLTLMFENRNSEDLASKLVYALNGGEFMQTVLKNFTVEVMAQKYRVIYKRISSTV